MMGETILCDCLNKISNYYVDDTDADRNKNHTRQISAKNINDCLSLSFQCNLEHTKHILK